jgi:hypothetical protein
MVEKTTLRSMSAFALPDFSLRWAGPGDDPVLRRLAELDSTRSLRQPVLLAECDGVALAAMSVADGRVAADPFEPTAQAVALLRLRAAQLGPPRRASRPGLRRLALG